VRQRLYSRQQKERNREDAYSSREEFTDRKEKGKKEENSAKEKRMNGNTARGEKDAEYEIVSAAHTTLKRDRGREKAI